MNDITAFQWITMAIALGGFGLGVFNAWRDINKGKLKLEIDASAGSPVDRFGNHVANPVLCIRIKNKSDYEVTIREIGFYLTDGQKAPVSLIDKFFGDSLPLVMKPKSGGTIYFHDDFRPIANMTVGPYVRTDLDVMVYRQGRRNIIKHK